MATQWRRAAEWSGRGQGRPEAGPGHVCGCRGFSGSSGAGRAQPPHAAGSFPPGLRSRPCLPPRSPPGRPGRLEAKLLPGLRVGFATFWHLLDLSLGWMGLLKEQRLLFILYLTNIFWFKKINKKVLKLFASSRMPSTTGA